MGQRPQSGERGRLTSSASLMAGDHRRRIVLAQQPVRLELLQVAPNALGDRAQCGSVGVAPADARKARVSAARRRRSRIVGLLACVGVVASAVMVSGPSAFAADPGQADPTFGSGGQVFTQVGVGDPTDLGRGAALQADGKLVVVGSAGSVAFSGFSVTRYLSSGQLDSSFGTSGAVKTTFSDISLEGAENIAVLPGGKLLVVGAAAPTGSSGAGLVAVRYNSDGSIDTSFGTSGKVFVGGASLPLYDAATALVTVESDGQLRRQL
jgi:uncharacterized delta-60 repeat protein